MSIYRISYEELIETFEAILKQYGFSPDDAFLCSKLFAKASLDGVASHGLNRFLPFIRLINEGYIDVGASPERIGSFGPFERWDGNLGPGNLNAYSCMKRAIEIAQKEGMGCVALRNTNHWMRGGNYGWQAIEEDCIGLCFTNTKPNMPGWGGSEPKLGNNPIVIAVPRSNGPVVLDMALAQFSYGKMDTYSKNDESLPYDGGFGSYGKLTRDPQKIIDNELALPIGLWKGAGLSLVLDIIAAVLSEGNATHQIGDQEEEFGISQVFLCFYPPKLESASLYNKKVDAIINDLKSSSTFGKTGVRYPGERTLATRKENLEKGVPVDKEIWEQVLNLRN